MDVFGIADVFYFAFSIRSDRVFFNGSIMATKYFNFRWKIGGMMVSKVGPIYVEVRAKHSFNIDFDHLSIPKLIDIAKEFGPIS